jgi:hypothetical protein
VRFLGRKHFWLCCKKLILSYNNIFGECPFSNRAVIKKLNNENGYLKIGVYFEVSRSSKLVMVGEMVETANTDVRMAL